MDPFDLQLCPEIASLLNKLHIHSPTFIDQVAIDSRRISSPHSIFFALQGTHDGHHFIENAISNGARFAVVKEDFPALALPQSIHLLRVHSPLQTLQSLAGSYRKQLKDTTFVAIAGSFGKTMLKDLLWNILRLQYPIAASPGSYNSQIGVPLSLFTVSSKDKIALIETAVSEPGEMDILHKMVLPDRGIITHFGKKHLHTMGDITTTVHEIMLLFKLLPKDSWLLAPKSTLLAPFSVKIDTDLICWHDRREHLPHAFTAGSTSDPVQPFTIVFPDKTVYESIIPGEHHYYIDLLNMAVKAAWLLGANQENILNILKDFTPEPTRTEIWQSSLGTTFINDSTCNDPLSIDQSLLTLRKAAGKGRKIFVFSGLRTTSTTPDHDYKRIGQALVKNPVDRLFLVGNHPYNALLEQIKSFSPQIQLSLCQDHEQAIDLLRQEARHDDVILLKGSRKLPFDTLAGAFADASCANLCIINLAAIEWNLQALKRHLPNDTRLMVMVKAHAYGSDSVRMARFLNHAGAHILGVSYVDEAVVLRRSGITMPIFVINVPPHEAAKIVKWNLEAGVSSLASIEAIGKEAERQKKNMPIHLHVDTGMSRFGCRSEDTLPLAQVIAQSPSLTFEGVMTHFACADDPVHDDFTLQQIALFDKCIEELQINGLDPKWKHAANSAGAIRFKLPQYNMVRIGLAAWGLHTSEAAASILELRLALSLISHIEGINLCKKGDTVSYGRRYRIEKDHQAIAVLPIGYFDGLHRHYSGKAHVMIRGHIAPMVGSICMDYMMVDVTAVPQVKVGDPVLIFGSDQYGQFLSPENLALSGNSIAHELITCLGPRIPRVFIHEEAL
ncbi:MAG: alanine racemase [Parachlamydiales bacterium]|jgi:alanine racemase/UDP-N-acetylmuramoyl-tripeptide--D-alanyl-D-alanine ligase